MKNLFNANKNKKVHIYLSLICTLLFSALRFLYIFSLFVVVVFVCVCFFSCVFLLLLLFFFLSVCLFFFVCLLLLFFVVVVFFIKSATLNEFVTWTCGSKFSETRTLATSLSRFIFNHRHILKQEYTLQHTPVVTVKDRTLKWPIITRKNDRSSHSIQVLILKVRRSENYAPRLEKTCVLHIRNSLLCFDTTE